MAASHSAMPPVAKAYWRIGAPRGMVAEPRPLPHCPFMPALLDTVALPLFVPGDRPDRYAKAIAAGADAVIIDLEDAVAPEAKPVAREALMAVRDTVAAAPCPVLVRVNGPGTQHHVADLAAVRQAPGIAAVLLAKAETAAEVAAAVEATGRPVLALIETARGLAAARAIAAAGARIAFGSIDFAADLGCAHTREALLLARSELVLASRLAGAPAPLDGVTTGVRDEAGIADDARYAASLGMGGKLLIHPAQIAPARTGLRPSAEEIAWAERVLATGDGAIAVDGVMVDAPVRLRAMQILRRIDPSPA